jgi:hypothetical protein
MLCINNYTQNYIDDYRSKIELQKSTYKRLGSTVKEHHVKGNTIKRLI